MVPKRICSWLVLLFDIQLALAVQAGEFVDASVDQQAHTPRFGETKLLVAQLGLEVKANNGPCAKLRCSFPLPMEWPEQTVEETGREVSANVRGIKIATLNGGVRQVQFSVPRLQRGETARVVFHLRIQRREIRPPPDTAALRIPVEPAAALRKYLVASPMIETKSPVVKRAAQQVQGAGDSAWNRVLAIRDYTHATISYSGVKALKGALRAIQDGDGDCEERTSVFVAICRLQGIPARSVWIPGHAYAEFYLENSEGQGSWYPCESVGGEFAQMGNGFVILQKGDSFRDPLKRGPQRYITETATGSTIPGGAPPVLQPIRRIEDVDLTDVNAP